MHNTNVNTNVLLKIDPFLTLNHENLPRKIEIITSTKEFCNISN